jgi:hypothetical protein
MEAEVVSTPSGQGISCRTVSLTIRRSNRIRANSSTDAVPLAPLRQECSIRSSKQSAEHLHVKTNFVNRLNAFVIGTSVFQNLT